MSITIQDLDNMPSDVYRKKLEDPAFCAEVEALLKSPTAAAPVVQPEGESIDPSMPDRAAQQPRILRTADRQPEGVVPTLTELPVTTVLVPVEQPEMIFEYQPLDEFNRPMGGKQVIKYRTQGELNQKLVEQNNLILRQLRKVSRENRLGKPDAGIPTATQRFTTLEFTEKPLTAEERFSLTQDLNDPEKFVSARDRLLESAVGVSPAELRKQLNDQQMTIQQLRAVENYRLFSTQTGFETGHRPTDEENVQTLTDWMVKNKVEPTVENFNLANSTLRSAGLLTEAPVVQQVPPVQPISVAPVESVVPQAQEPVVPPARISVVEPVQPKRHSQVPSGLNDRVSSASGLAPATANSLTLADIDAMSADQYKKASRNPDFKNLVNRLQKDADDRRRQRVNA